MPFSPVEVSLAVFFFSVTQFPEHDARNQAEIFLIFFLTLISLFSLIV